MGNIAKLQEGNEAVDVPFARLGMEDGTHFAKLEPTDEDVDVPFARLGLGRIQRRKLRRRNRMMKKIQRKGGEVDDLAEDEELNASDEKEEGEEILIQSVGRDRFRQRRRKGGNRGENKRSRVKLSRRLLDKLRTWTNNKERRNKKTIKDNESEERKNKGKRHGRHESEFKVPSKNIKFNIFGPKACLCLLQIYLSNISSRGIGAKFKVSTITSHRTLQFDLKVSTCIPDFSELARKLFFELSTCF